MNRDEHLRWARDRAMDYLDRGEFVTALASWTSDVGKHPETRREVDEAKWIHALLLAPYGGPAVAAAEFRRSLDEVFEP